MKSKYRGILYAVAIFLLAIAMAQMGFWIYITTQHEPFLEAKAAYLDAFPTTLQNAILLTIIDVVFLFISFVVFMQSISADYRRNLSIVLAILSGLLGAWNFLSLM